MELSEIIKGLGDETRLRILNLISRKELCLCIIMEVLGLLQPNASKHISKLKSAGVIECRKVSQWCFFRIDEEFKEKYAELYACLEHEWGLEKKYANDVQKLEYLIETNDCCRELILKRAAQKRVAGGAGG